MPFWFLESWFGVLKDPSGLLSKVYDLGRAWLILMHQRWQKWKIRKRGNKKKLENWQIYIITSRSLSLVSSLAQHVHACFASTFCASRAHKNFWKKVCFNQLKMLWNAYRNAKKKKKNLLLWSKVRAAQRNEILIQSIGPKFQHFR